MLKDVSHTKREISTFPKPYNSKATPFLSNNNFITPSADVANLQKTAKVIVLGDMAIGKTCLLERFIRKHFDYTSRPTIAPHFNNETFNIVNVPFVLQIWDTLGQERFQSLSRSYYRNAHVVILMFDLSNRSTLETVHRWLEVPLEENPDRPLVFLVGTKLDLISESMFEDIEKEVISKANELKAEYWPVSAYHEKNVNELFSRVAALAFNTVIKKAEPVKQTVTLIDEG